MRRIILLSVMLVLLAGCAPPPQQQGPETYGVVFSDTPSILDQKIYFMGERIGEIVNRQTAPNLAVRLDVTIDAEKRALLTQGTVFYVSAGQLTLDNLSGYAPPAETGDFFPGFGSRISLGFFKFRNLLGQPSVAARERTLALAAAFPPL